MTKSGVETAIDDMKDDIRDIKGKMDIMQRWIWVVTGVLMAMGLSNLPGLGKVLAEGLK